MMNFSLFKKASSHWLSADRQMMATALQLAKKGQYTARPNPMVGCVIVKNDHIVGRGWHQKAGLAHAEVNALNQALENAHGATCYVTLEPCAHDGKTGPCAKALVNAGVKKVIVAMKDPNPQVAGKGFAILAEAGIVVEYGLLEAEAKALNCGFISRFNRKRPWVTCKLAMSLDGRTALSSGESQWITGSAARSDVQKLRAQQDAIITGIGTVLKDNPSLNVRGDSSFSKVDRWFHQATQIGFSQPARVLLDRHASADDSATIFNKNTRVFWVTDKAVEHDKSHVKAVSAKQSLLQLLEYLAAQEMNNVLLESGHQLAGQFLQQGLIDELYVYMAPKLMGDKAKGLFALDVSEMQQALTLNLKDVRLLGDDIRLIYEMKE